VNYSFYMGATNDNIDELIKTNPEKCVEVKVYGFIDRKYAGG